MATATTAFSVVDAELWKPLPFPEPHRLVVVYADERPGTRGIDGAVAGADFLRLAGAEPASADYAAEGDLEPARAASRRRPNRCVSARSRRTTSACSARPPRDRPRLDGRTANGGPRGHADRTRPGGGCSTPIPSVARPHASQSTTSRSRSSACTAASLEFRRNRTVFLAIDPTRRTSAIGHDRTVNVIGRLRPGTTAAAAQAEMQAIAARIARRYPEGRAGTHVVCPDLKAYNTGYNWRPLLLLPLRGRSGAAADLRQRRGAGARAGAAPPARVRAPGRARRRTRRARAPAARRRRAPGGARRGGSALLLTAGRSSVFAAHASRPTSSRAEATSRSTRASALAAFALAGRDAIVFGLAPMFFARRVDLNLMLGQGGRTAGRSPRQARARHLLLAAQWP